MRVRVASTVLALVACLAPQAAAQPGSPREAARQHYERGLELAHAQQYDQAIAELRAAYALVPHAAVLCNIGQAYIALGRPVEAVTALERCLAEGQGELPADRVELVTRQVEEQRARTGELRVGVSVAGATVELDGVSIGQSPIAPVLVNPGSHRLRVAAPDGAVVTQTIEVAPGQVVDIAIQLPVTRSQPAATPRGQLSPPSSQLSPSLGDPSWNREPGALPASAVPSPELEPQPRSHDYLDVCLLEGAGIIAGAAAVGHYLWNRSRYEQWQQEDRALVAERVEGDYEKRLARNNELAASINRAERVTVGFAAGSGALIVTGLTLLVLRAPWEDEHNSAEPPRLTGSVVQQEGGLEFCLEGRW